MRIVPVRECTPDEQSVWNILKDDIGTNKNNRPVDVEYVTDGEGLLVSSLAVANPYDVTWNGIDYVLCGLQMRPSSQRIKPKKGQIFNENEI